jgi:hypothetical protein
LEERAALPGEELMRREEALGVGLEGVGLLGEVVSRAFAMRTRASCSSLLAREQRASSTSFVWLQVYFLVVSAD